MRAKGPTSSPDGPFALVRNPIFAAMIPTSLGLALMVPNVVALAGFAALVLALEIQVRMVEEPYLRRVHGQAYASYAARTGRFAPGVGRTNRVKLAPGMRQGRTAVRLASLLAAGTLVLHELRYTVGGEAGRPRPLLPATRRGRWWRCC